MIIVNISFLLPFGSFAISPLVKACIRLSKSLSTPFWEFLSLVDSYIDRIDWIAVLFLLPFGSFAVLLADSQNLLNIAFYSLLGVSVGMKKELRPSFNSRTFYSLLGVSGCSKLHCK